MLTRFVKLVRLTFFIMMVGLNGCSIYSPKPEVVDTQAAVLGPISTELQQTFADALALLSDEKYEEAEVLLLEITSKYPTYAGPWSNLAIAQNKLEKFELALVSIDNALLQDDKFCQALSLKGIILRELGKFTLAKEQYLSALVCDPNDGLTLYNLGVLFDLYLHDNATALSYYQQYLSSQGEQKDEVVQSWVVDLKRRLPEDVTQEPEEVAREDELNSVDVVKNSAEDVETSIDVNTSEPQLAGDE